MASRSWNRVELIGNLTRDPELRFTPNGAAVCTFSLATNRSFVTDGEKREEVDFHRLVAWNKLAELCNQLLKKGTKVFVSGRLQTRSWTGQDNIQRQTTEIVIEDMIVLTPKGSSDSSVVTHTEELSVADLQAEFSKEPVKKTEDRSVVEKIEEEVKVEKQEDESKGETAPQEEVKDDLPF